jgi:hypothetical protein
MSLSFTLSSFDPDDDTITYSMLATVTGLTLNDVTGYFEWTPGFEESGVRLTGSKHTARI